MRIRHYPCVKETLVTTDAGINYHIDWWHIGHGGRHGSQVFDGEVWHYERKR